MLRENKFSGLHHSFQAQFQKKFDHFSPQTIQSKQARKPFGSRITNSPIPSSSETVSKWNGNKWGLTTALGMRRPKLAKELRTTLACVGTHAVGEVQMAEMDATQKRV